MSREVMQQALEALESSRVFVTTREKIKHPEGTEWYDERITALRTALKEPDAVINGMPAYEGPLSKAQRTEPEQEPVAWMAPDGKVSKTEGPLFYLPLYLHPPQRKPLTDEEITQISIDTPINLYAFARAIEAAHGIKQEEA